MITLTGQNFQREDYCSKTEIIFSFLFALGFLIGMSNWSKSTAWVGLKVKERGFLIKGCLGVSMGCQGFPYGVHNMDLLT